MALRNSTALRALRLLLRRDPARLPSEVQAIPDPAARFRAAMRHHGTSEAMLATLLSAARVQALGFAVLALAAVVLHMWFLAAVLVWIACDRARMATEISDRRFYSLRAWVLAVLPKEC